MVNLIKLWLRKRFSKMHGPKSKFIMKVVQVRKQEDFWKGGRRFLKLKKMGGDEGTILKSKVTAMEKNHLTNTKPTLDINKSIYNSHPLDWNQASKDTKPLKNTKLQMSKDKMT